MYMIPLFALALRRSEEFTNALVARGDAVTGEASRVKRADFILTHYTFRPLDAVMTVVIGLAFVSILVMRFGLDAFSVEESWLINWLMGLLVQQG